MMRFLHSLVAGLATLALLVPAPADAAAKALSNQREQLDTLEKGPLKSMPTGKTLATHVAPNKSTTLIVRDEGEQGDFVWRTLYVKRGQTYQAIGTCQEIEKVTWSVDSATVGFVMKRATDYNKVTTYRVRYKVGDKKIGLTPTSEMQLES